MDVITTDSVTIGDTTVLVDEEVFFHYKHSNNEDGSDTAPPNNTEEDSVNEMNTTPVLPTVSDSR